MFSSVLIMFNDDLYLGAHQRLLCSQCEETKGKRAAIQRRGNNTYQSEKGTTQAEKFGL